MAVVALGHRRRSNNNNSKLPVIPRLEARLPTLLDSNSSNNNNNSLFSDQVVEE